MDENAMTDILSVLVPPVARVSGDFSVRAANVTLLIDIVCWLSEEFMR
jgi:hypothetical protein